MDWIYTFDTTTGKILFTETQEQYDKRLAPKESPYRKLLPKVKEGRLPKDGKGDPAPAAVKK